MKDQLGSSLLGLGFKDFDKNQKQKSLTEILKADISKDFNVQISVNESVEDSFVVIQEEPEPDESEITMERTATKVKFSEVIHEIPQPESREESPVVPLSRKELMRQKRRNDSIKKI